MARKARSGWNYKKDISGGGIPDAMAIHMARKKREAAREAGGREDFIPINKEGASRYSFNAKSFLELNNKSTAQLLEKRLLR